MRPTSTPPCGAGLNAIRASTSTSPRPPGSTWSSACSPISPVVVCVGDAFAVSPNSNQRSDATLTTATPLPNRSFGPKGPTALFENTNGLNGTLFRGRDTQPRPVWRAHVFESRLPIYGVDDITLYSDLLCCASALRDGIIRSR